MFVAEVIGNLGRDAEKRQDNGREYLQFSVAHTVRFKRSDGSTQENTTWVSCFYGNTEGDIINYLKAGQRVFVRGNAETRLYSSEKDRKLKAGITINVREIELVGGSSEAVPRELVAVDGLIVRVNKYYWVDMQQFGDHKPCTLFDRKGTPFDVNENGWVTPVENVVNDEQQEQQQAEQAEAKTNKKKTEK